MRIKVFSKRILKKINPKKIVTRGACLLLAGALSCTLFSCKKENSTSDSFNTSSSNTSITNTQDDYSKEPTESILSQIEDTSEDYSMMYIGDGKDFSIKDSNFLEYKDTDNAFTRDASEVENIDITLTVDAKEEYLKYLSDYKVEIAYSDLFNLEHLLERRENEHLDVKHTNRMVLSDNRFVADTIYETIMINNSNYPYTTASGFTIPTNDELKTVSHILEVTLNKALDDNEYVDIDSLLCNMATLKVFKENDVTNARITDDNVLVISDAMIKSLQTQVKSDAYTLTITHEGEHIPQLNCDDEVDKTEGNIIGFNRKWKDEPINSLFWQWYYEASAEALMMNDTGESAIVYENMVNYIKYLKMTMLPESSFDINSIEKASVSRNPDDFYNIFGATTLEDKLELSKIMFAIDIVHNERSDFAQIYLKYTGSTSSTPDFQEWSKLKRELKASVAISLSKKFYGNLTSYVASGNATLRDIYRLITIYEAEIEQHILYDSTTRYNENEPFLSSYVEIQDSFWRTLANSNSISYDEIVDGFNKYSLKDESSLIGLPESTKEFLDKRSNELTKHITTNIRTTYHSLKNVLNPSKTLDLN